MNETWVLQHLNQPSITCGSWINELSRFHHCLPTPWNHSPVEPEHPPSQSYDGFFASEMANDHQGENDDPSLYYPHQDPTMPVINYHPNTPSVHPGGTVFMDQFFNDQYATLRQENLYYPFASRMDWQLASWLLRSRLSMAAIDDFLSLELVCNGRILYLFILSYRARLSYLITALVLSLFFIYGCGLVSS